MILINIFQLFKKKHEFGVCNSKINSISKELQIDERSSNDLTFHYISDIHAEFLLMRDKRYKERTETFEEIALKLYSTYDKNGYVLIAGDTFFNTKDTYDFYLILTKYIPPNKIFVVLGNHELWHSYGDKIDLSKAATLEEKMCLLIEPYRQLFDSLGVNFLENDLICCKNSTLIKLSEKQLISLTEAEIQDVTEGCDFLILGGLGYSGYDKHYNCTKIIWSLLSSVDDELIFTNRFLNLYKKLTPIVCDKKAICLTHTCRWEWIDTSLKTTWIHVSGHTHHNKKITADSEIIYADNQIGYNGRKYTLPIALKSFNLSKKIETKIENVDDGYFPISHDQYNAYWETKGENYRAKERWNVVRLHKNGVDLFVSKSGDTLSILKGNSEKKLVKNELSYYLEQLDSYFSIISEKYREFFQILERISQQIMSFGGDGRIHGSIVDIDFYNHIFVDPDDLEAVAYNSPSYNQVKAYENIQSLLFYERKDLYSSLTTMHKEVDICNGDAVFEETAKKLRADYSNVSKKMTTITRMLKNNVVLEWDDDILE